MAELMEGAGLPRPEIEALSGAVVVRFRPGRYTAPMRVARDLSPGQQRILEVLAGVPEGLPGRDITSRSGQPAWVVRSDLSILRSLGLVSVSGHARGARWLLTQGRVTQKGGSRRRLDFQFAPSSHWMRCKYIRTNNLLIRTFEFQFSPIRIKGPVVHQEPTTQSEHAKHMGVTARAAERHLTHFVELRMMSGTAHPCTAADYQAAPERAELHGQGGERGHEPDRYGPIRQSTS